VFNDIISSGTENEQLENGSKYGPDFWINKPLVKADGLTLLDMAVKTNQADFVGVLLRNGADASLPNPGKFERIQQQQQHKSIKIATTFVLGEK